MSESPRLRLHTILINYRTADMTIDSLDAFLREMGDRRDFHVTLVDNASRDGSVERLRSAIDERGVGDRVTLVESDRNGGFSYGVNHGLRAGPDAEFVYLLNSDAFPHDGAVAKLEAFLSEHPGIGIAGSYIHGPDGDPHVTAFRFPSILGELEGALRLGVATKLLADSQVPIHPIPTENTRVDWLAGASMLIRSDVLREVGSFDDQFFLYYEETDFCRRALRRGFETWYIPSSQVAHIGSVSTGMKKVDKPRPSFWFESRAHYFRKNHGRLYLWLADLVWVAAYSVWRVRRALQGKPDPDNPGLLGDFVRAMFRRSRPQPARDAS